MPLYQIHGYKSLSNYKERELAAAIINFHVQHFVVDAASVHVNFVYRCGESLDKWFHVRCSLVALQFISSSNSVCTDLPQGPILVAPSISQQYPGRTSTLWDGRQNRDEYSVLLRVGANSETNWDVFCEELQKLWDTAINSGKGGHELKSIMIEKSLVHQWQSGKSVSLGLDAAPPYDGPPAASAASAAPPET